MNTLQKFKLKVFIKEAKFVADVTQIQFLSEGYLVQIYDYALKDFFWFEDEEVELMRFTGTYDKNGDEIYEGHILSWREHVFMYGTDLDTWVTEYTGVEYTEELGMFTIWGDSEGLFPANEKAVIVGDIYQNAELLEHKD